LFSFALILSILINTATAAEAPADAQPESPAIVPIIMYHEVKNFKLGKDVISPYDFESDLQYLQKQRYTTVAIGDLIDYVNCVAPLPENPIVLSFDDGYLSTYKYVLPLLKKYGMKIVLSLIVKDTDDFSRSKDNHIDYAHVMWRQLNEMLDTGLVEVQNHSYDLHKIKNGRYGCIPKSSEPPDKYEAILKKDVLKAQNKIYMMTGRQPLAFSYPYGSYCDATDIILKKLGFQATLSCRYGINILSRSNPDGLFRLKRLCRSHSESLSRLLDEAYETIRKNGR
jgi:peptidoglycan/xylan/chitin deacetylase (PgdA/CDA1 family)